MKKKWYEIVTDLGIDLNPIIWFIMSAIFIFTGYWIIYSGIEEESPHLAAIGTLVAALGGAGIARVRSSRVSVQEVPPSDPE